MADFSLRVAQTRAFRAAAATPFEARPSADEPYAELRFTSRRGYRQYCRNVRLNRPSRPSPGGAVAGTMRDTP